MKQLGFLFCLKREGILVQACFISLLKLCWLKPSSQEFVGLVAFNPPEKKVGNLRSHPCQSWRAPAHMAQKGARKCSGSQQPQEAQRKEPNPQSPKTRTHETQILYYSLYYTWPPQFQEYFFVHGRIRPATPDQKKFQNFIFSFFSFRFEKNYFFVLCFFILVFDSSIETGFIFFSRARPP